MLLSLIIIFYGSITLTILNVAVYRGLRKQRRSLDNQKVQKIKREQYDRELLRWSREDPHKWVAAAEQAAEIQWRKDNDLPPLPPPAPPPLSAETMAAQVRAVYIRSYNGHALGCPCIQCEFNPHLGIKHD